MTTKELNTKSFEYILSCIDGENYGKELITDKDKLQFLNDTFIDEFCYHENLKYYGSHLRTFESWICGMPSCFNIDYNVFDILCTVKSWDLIYSNTTKKQQDNIIENWFEFISKKTFQLMKIHNVLPY